MPAALAHRSNRTPTAVRALAAFGFPFIAALTVIGTYLGKEVIVTAAWVAGGTVGFLFVRPAIGIAVMTGAYMLAAYPTVLQAMGVLTINNLLGAAFVLLLGLRILETRDLSFLKARPVVILVVIGVIFWVSDLHSQTLFPLLGQSRGRVFMLDRSDDMWHDFETRLVFLIFIVMFVREKADIKLVFAVFFLALFMAVPSALWNLLSGNLNKGFRIMSSVTAGSNPNRLAMICLIEVACFWCWAHANPTRLRMGVSLAAIGACIVVLFGTGSRSGLLGLGLLGITMQLSGKRYSLRPAQIGLLGGLGLVALFTVVPAAARERMFNFSPDRGEIGASSNKLREETVWTAVDISMDHPILGIGLGNFREVSRQVYRDKFFRPPHNSYLWAMTEGGAVVLSAYLVLFWFMWSDIQRINQLASLAPDLAHVGAALRVVFVLWMFFSGFADLWLSPQTYIMAGILFVTRRYFDGLAAPVRVRAQRPATAPMLPMG